QAEDGIRDRNVTGVQTCALPISHPYLLAPGAHPRRCCSARSRFATAQGCPALAKLRCPSASSVDSRPRASIDVGPHPYLLAPGEIGRASCRGSRELRVGGGGGQS